MPWHEWLLMYCLIGFVLTATAFSVKYTRVGTVWELMGALLWPLAFVVAALPWPKDDQDNGDEWDDLRISKQAERNGKTCH